MHLKKANIESYAKYGLFLLSLDYLVVWATMMGDECFIISVKRMIIGVSRTGYLDAIGWLVLSGRGHCLSFWLYILRSSYFVRFEQSVCHF